MNFLVTLNSQPVDDIISGISTILPTINNNISSTLDDLISGTNFIKPISEELKNKIFEKNIIKLKKDNNGSIYKSLVTKDTEHLSLYASIDNFNIDLNFVDYLIYVLYVLYVK